VVSDNRARLFSSDISWLEGIKDFWIDDDTPQSSADCISKGICWRSFLGSFFQLLYLKWREQWLPKGQWQLSRLWGYRTPAVVFVFPEAIHGPSSPGALLLMSTREKERGLIASNQRGWAHTPGDEITFHDGNCVAYWMYNMIQSQA
jgi:hypothetical protein